MRRLAAELRPEDWDYWRAFYLREASRSNPEPTEWDSPLEMQKKLDHLAAAELK